MKKILLLIFLAPVLVQSQKNDTIVLSTIGPAILASINNQGLKLFKRSDCYNHKEEYFSIPEFFVHCDIPLGKLKFDNNEQFLSNLFFNRSSHKKLITEISWNMFLKRNSYVQSSSDFKMFYCYNLDSRFMDTRDSNLTKIRELRYIFRIYQVDLSISFLVSKENEVYVHFDRERKVMTLSEFNELYKKGEIERFKTGF